jgi:hypothetical protein
VPINPIATNSVCSPVDSAKNFNSFGAGIQQDICLQGASSCHGSSAVIRADSVWTPVPNADPVCSLNPEVDAADTTEPMPVVDSPATPTLAQDAVPVDDVSAPAAVRGQDSSSAVHVPLAARDSRSSVPGSSTLPTEGLTSGLSGAAESLGSAASPAQN